MQILVYQRLIRLFATIIVASTFCIDPMESMAEKNQPKLREHWRAQVRTDISAEVLTIAKEITEYYDKKYPSLSGRLYIEKSN